MHCWDPHDLWKRWQLWCCDAPHHWCTRITLVHNTCVWWENPCSMVVKSWVWLCTKCKVHANIMNPIGLWICPHARVSTTRAQAWHPCVTPHSHQHTRHRPWCCERAGLCGNAYRCAVLSFQHHRPQLLGCIPHVQPWCAQIGCVLMYNVNHHIWHSTTSTKCACIREHMCYTSCKFIH